MKSDFGGIEEADLISSEAKAEDFIRACEDFIVQSTISLKNIQGLRLDLSLKVRYNKLTENPEDVEKIATASCLSTPATCDLI